MIATGEDIVPEDFINESEADAVPANDAGRVPKLESDGKLSRFFLNKPTIDVISTVNSDIGNSTTQFDITNPAGDTFRYTYDGTGTDPSINSGTFPIGSAIEFNAQNFNSNNNGLFLVTGVGTNYVEVTNASGVVESNKTIGTGYVIKQSVWTKPSNLAYAIIELVGGGGGGGGADVAGSEGAGGGSGGGGGYSKKIISAEDLDLFVPISIGKGGSGGGSGLDGGSGRTSRFGGHCSGSGGGGGKGSATNPVSGGDGGSGSGGDVNIDGGDGGGGAQKSTATRGGFSVQGGASILGGGGKGVGRTSSGVGTNGGDGNLYGGGGAGGFGDNNGDANGGNGGNGGVIITMFI